MRSFTRDSSRPALARDSSTSSAGTSPEDVMRKIFLRWINFRIEEGALSGPEGVRQLCKGLAPLRDLRDLCRTENLVAIASVCCNERIPGAVDAPSVRENDHNIEVVIEHLAKKTEIEWGARKLITGVQSKQSGFLELLAWHLVEVGELIPLGLPFGLNSLPALSEAIERRLAKFIVLQQFHFRYTKEMLFDIVTSCSSSAWQPDRNLPDVANIRSALEEVGRWGVSVVVEPSDIKYMGSVNEKGFLMFFMLFIPSLEGIRGPKKKKAEPPKPEPVVVAAPPPREPEPVVVKMEPVVDTRAIERLEKSVSHLEAERATLRETASAANQQVENLTMRAETLEDDILVLNGTVRRLESSLANAKVNDENCQVHLQELAAAKAKIAELELQLSKVEERIRLQDFDGLENKYKNLIVELSTTQTNLTNAQLESEKVLRQMHALELKMPLFLRQGKNTVEPPHGDVTLVFTDVEGSTVQWEWEPDAMAVAIRVHNDLLRKQLHEHGGYEVKTEGDAFMCAFADPFVAVKWCLDSQEKLLLAEWPEKIYEHDKSKVEISKTGKTIFKGLRVRMGIHVGRPSNEEDPVTGRMDYFGPMVNRSARVESVANGGQIVMSSDVYDRVIVQLQTTAHIPEVVDLGSFELKGLQDPTRIFQILPASLTERKFEAIVTKEKELANEKKKLETQLQELQEKNQRLATQLVGMDNDVKGQMAEAAKLLDDVQNARLVGAPPAEMMALLKDQLMKLLQGQTETSRELRIAQLSNEEQFKAANLAAERREKLAVATVMSEKAALETQLNNMRANLEQVKKMAQEMDVERTEATSTLRNVEKKAREDRLEVMNLRVLVAELQALLASGAGGQGGGGAVVGPAMTVSESGAIRAVPEHREGGPVNALGSSASEGFLKAKAELERAVKYDQCVSCDLAIREGQEKIQAANNFYHQFCFSCCVCGKLFGEEKFYLMNNKPVHDECRD